MIARTAAFIFGALLSLTALANIEAPDQLVKRVAGEALHIVQTDPELQAGNADRAMELVEEKILPHFDFKRITASAVGISWRTATPEQKVRLQQEFKTLLVRTYSSALSRVSDQKLDYKPLQMKPEDTRTVVRSLILQSGAEPIAVDYRMLKQPDGWKVYDVIVAGVSLVTTYRTTFSEEVNRAGVDGLVQMLVDKNAELRASANSKSKAAS
jgi:phospholipid transport system substrate-binding protein